MKTAFLAVIVACSLATVVLGAGEKPELEDLQRTLHCANRKLSSLVGELSHFELQEKRTLSF